MEASLMETSALEQTSFFPFTCYKKGLNITSKDMEKNILPRLSQQQEFPHLNRLLAWDHLDILNMVHSKIFVGRSEQVVVVEETNGSSHFQGHFLHSVSAFSSCYFFTTITRSKRHSITIPYLERFGNSHSTQEGKKNEVCIHFLFKVT